MNYPDFNTGSLFGDVQENRPVVDPQSIRRSMIASTPAAREKYVLDVVVAVDYFDNARSFINAMLDSSRYTKQPGGLWLVGDGGTGKTFILNSVHRENAPVESEKKRICPVLSLSFRSVPDRSGIFKSLLLQLGTDPFLLEKANLNRLKDMFGKAIGACDTRLVLYDEAHHLWNKAKKGADNAGGVVGNFLKLLYDDFGLAYVFAGTELLNAFGGPSRTSTFVWIALLQ